MVRAEGSSAADSSASVRHGCGRHPSEDVDGATRGGFQRPAELPVGEVHRRHSGAAKQRECDQPRLAGLDVSGLGPCSRAGRVVERFLRQLPRAGPCDRGPTAERISSAWHWKYSHARNQRHGQTVPGKPTARNIVSQFARNIVSRDRASPSQSLPKVRASGADTAATPRGLSRGPSFPREIQARSKKSRLSLSVPVRVADIPREGQSAPPRVARCDHASPGRRRWADTPVTTPILGVSTRVR